MNAAHGGGHGLGLPWLAPIRNSSELRGLCYRSCFGPRTCVRGITNYRNVLGLSIRVSPSHPYNAGSAGLGWGGGRHRENVCTPAEPAPATLRGSTLLFRRFRGHLRRNFFFPFFSVFGCFCYKNFFNMARFLSFLVQHHHKFSAQPEYLVKTYVGAKKSQKKVEGSEGGTKRYMGTSL